MLVKAEDGGLTLACEGIGVFELLPEGVVFEGKLADLRLLEDDGPRQIRIA